MHLFFNSITSILIVFIKLHFYSTFYIYIYNNLAVIFYSIAVILQLFSQYNSFKVILYSIVHYSNDFVAFYSIVYSTAFLCTCCLF